MPGPRLMMLAVLALALTPEAPASGDAAFVCDESTRCEDILVPADGLPVPAGTNKSPTQFYGNARVLLPEGHGSGPRYPVLYLLPGVGDDYTAWTTQTDVASVSERSDLIIVMPDAGKGADAGWYSDWSDGSRMWETFHVERLIPYIDATYDTLGDGYRAVAGASMGGFGAMSYTARHPGLFQAAASFSGFLDTMHEAPLSGLVYDMGGEGCCGGQSLGTPRQEVWGDQLTNGDSWRSHNPTDLALTDASPGETGVQSPYAGEWLYVASGNGSPGGEFESQNPALYAEENYVWQQNESSVNDPNSRSFTASLAEAGVERCSDSIPPPCYTPHFYAGYHGWPYWERELHASLPGLYVAIAPGPGAIEGTIANVDMRRGQTGPVLPETT